MVANILWGLMLGCREINWIPRLAQKLLDSSDIEPSMARR